MTHGTLIQIGEICTEAGVAPWAEGERFRSLQTCFNGHLSGASRCSQASIAGPSSSSQCLGWVFRTDTPQGFKHWVFCPLTQKEGVALPSFMKGILYTGEQLGFCPPIVLCPHSHTCLLQLYLSVHRCGTMRISKQPGQKAGRLGLALAVSWSRMHAGFSCSSLSFLLNCHECFLFYKGSRRASYSHDASGIHSLPTTSIS